MAKSKTTTKKITQKYIYKIEEFKYYSGPVKNSLSGTAGKLVTDDIATGTLQEVMTSESKTHVPDAKGMVELNHNYIKYIMIENSYDEHTSGAIYISLHIPAKIYRKLLKNENTKNGYITLVIRPKNVDSQTSSKSDYINGRFKYMISNSNPDYSVALESKEEPDKSYKSLLISLVNNNSIDTLKTFQNGLYYKVTQSELVRTVIAGFKNVIVQPFHNDVELTQVLIPPMNNRRKLLEYIFNIAPFYNTKYTFFADFNYVYLVANDGKYKNTGSNALTIKTANGTTATYKIGNITFHIDSAAADESYEVGMTQHSKTTTQTNKKKKTKKDYIQKDTYHIYVNPAKIAVTPNKGIDMISNVLASVDEDGVVKSTEDSGAIELDYGLKETSGNKIAMRRGEYTEVLANILNSDSAYIQLEKAHINGQFLSPDKMFFVKFEYTEGDNKKMSEQYDGYYYLTYKRELIRNNGDTFAVACAIGLKKVPTNVKEVKVRTKNGIQYESQGALKFAKGNFSRGERVSYKSDYSGGGGGSSSYSSSSSGGGYSSGGTGSSSSKTPSRNTDTMQRASGGRIATVNAPAPYTERKSFIKGPGKAGIDMDAENGLDEFRDSRGFITGTDYNPKLYDMSNCGPIRFEDPHEPETHP